jgi:uncharacterized protein
MPENHVKIEVGVDHSVSGILHIPRNASTCYVFAHGAGAGMAHPFMAAIADRLANRAVATLRYQFPYMEQGSKRPDRPALAHATVRAAVSAVAKLAPGLPLIAGGKSFGGRMTSQAQAEEPLPNVVGLAFLGFPLHPPGKPSEGRAQHLFNTRVPMLFLQGTRDKLAELDRLRRVVERLGKRATLILAQGADHSFHVPASSGRTDGQVLDELLDSMAVWIAKAWT